MLNLNQLLIIFLCSCILMDFIVEFIKYMQKIKKEKRLQREMLLKEEIREKITFTYNFEKDFEFLHYVINYTCKNYLFANYRVTSSNIILDKDFNEAVENVTKIVWHYFSEDYKKRLAHYIDEPHINEYVTQHIYDFFLKEFTDKNRKYIRSIS